MAHLSLTLYSKPVHNSLWHMGLAVQHCAMIWPSSVAFPCDPLYLPCRLRFLPLPSAFLLLAVRLHAVSHHGHLLHLQISQQKPQLPLLLRSLPKLLLASLRGLSGSDPRSQQCVPTQAGAKFHTQKQSVEVLFTFGFRADDGPQYSIHESNCRYKKDDI